MLWSEGWSTGEARQRRRILWSGFALFIVGLFANAGIDPGPDRGDPAQSIGHAIAALAPVLPGVLVFAWVAWPVARRAVQQRRAREPLLWVCAGAVLMAGSFVWSFAIDITGPHRDPYAFVLLVGLATVFGGAVWFSWSVRRARRAEPEGPARSDRSAPRMRRIPPRRDFADVPAWPWWYAPLGLVAVVGVTFGIVEAIHAVLPITRITATLILQVAYIAAAVSFAHRRGAFSRARLGLQPMRITPGRAVLWIAGLFIASSAVISVYLALVPPTGHLVLFTHRPHTTLSSIALVVSAVIGAPIAEELFFRGFFYRALRSRLALWPAVLVSSAVFGLMHWVGGDPFASAAPRAIFGVVVCLLLERTGSLYPGMAMHATLNASVLAWVAPGAAWVPGIAEILAIIACVALSVRDPRRKNPPHARTGHLEPDRPRSRKPGRRAMPPPRVA